MAVCGLAKAAVNGVWAATRPFKTDIEGRFVYVAEGERRWLIAAFDFSYMFRRSSRAWREAIAEATGIPVECIWVHELQNHSAPIALELDGEPVDRLVEACLPAIQKAIAGACEAEVSFAVIDLGDRFNLNREQYVPGLGMVTVWHGLEFDEAGRPFTQDAGLMLMCGYKPELPAFEKPIYFDRPADPQGVIVVLRQRDGGKVLGTLARFAAHADVFANCTWDLGRGDPKDLWYHFDWPGYLRRRLEETLGGVGVTLCGPCGDLSTRNRHAAGSDAGDRRSREIGCGIADALLEAWHSKPRWRPLDLGPVVYADLDLPLRDTVPTCRDEIAAAEPRSRQVHQEFEAAIRSNAPAWQVKQLADLHQHWLCMDRIIDRWAGLSEDELRRRAMRVELQAVRLGDLVLAGLPGESMAETSQWLRAQSLGRRLVTVDQVNGYCAYQTTSEQYDMGGYAYWCSCLAREATNLTRRKSLDLIRRCED